MASVPAVTPVTMPVGSTVAFVLLLLHMPPAMPSVNEIDEATHTLDGPAIVPASGKGFTRIDLVAVAVPHTVVTL